jgi:hypothetical protein
LTVTLTPRRACQLAIGLVLIALSVLLTRPAPAPASPTHGCSSSAATRAKQHVRACAGRHRSAHSHAKVKSHHAKHNHSKKKSKATGKSTHTPAAAQRPATCEDGTTPARDSEGEYTCGDGSDPICAGGAEPAVTHGRLLCPATPSSGTEFNEPNCEDGSSPERSEDTGVYECEDGSRPTCENGTQPVRSDDGSMLVCISSGGGAAGSSSSPAEETEEGEAEDEAEVRRAAPSPS